MAVRMAHAWPMEEARKSTAAKANSEYRARRNVANPCEIPYVLTQQPLAYQEQSVQRPPQHERPRRAMPQAHQYERDQYIEVPARASLAISAQRLQDVVTHPACERHVPARPQLGDPDRSKGVFEIHRETKTEHQRGADRAQGIAAEIA